MTVFVWFEVTIQVVFVMAELSLGMLRDVILPRLDLMVLSLAQGVVIYSSLQFGKRWTPCIYQTHGHVGTWNGNCKLICFKLFIH